MADNGKKTIIGARQSTTEPTKSPVRVPVQPALPCITFLVHGVNDVGEAYRAQEHGLCEGLNARLDRGNGKSGGDLRPYEYRIPKPDDALASDPDAVYFRRFTAPPPASKIASVTAVHSPVIPFYWGFREKEGEIQRGEWHGQWLDRFGNRLDKNGAKGGGPFANATTTLPDMWSKGYNGKVLGSEAAARIASDPLHRVDLKAPERRYMVLAAKRLAMLIKIIRAKQPTDIINLVGHSQGCMVSLLAQAFLAEDGVAPADSLILNHPPYSLEETATESVNLGPLQQTTYARVTTLVQIVDYVFKNKQPASPLVKMTDHTCNEGVVGRHWKPGAGSTKFIPSPTSQKVAFIERDNCGKVYLYFCPEDHTVGLKNVQGIGWQGVPDKAAYRRYDDHTVPAMDVLKNLNFKQRVFTSRTRWNKPKLVGDEIGRYTLEEVFELSSTLSAQDSDIKAGGQRWINGEILMPPVTPNLTVGEGDGWLYSKSGKLTNSPIDAGVAVGSGGIEETTTKVDDWRPAVRRGQPLTAAECKEYEDRLNQGRKRDPNDRHHVFEGTSSGTEHVKIRHTTETPDAARARWQKKTDTNSYHSSIVANAAHSSGVTAYDLAVGFAHTADDPVFYDYLCAVADWRTDWQKLILTPIGTDPAKTIRNKEIVAKRDEDIAASLDLVTKAYDYFITGDLPAEIKTAKIPPLVVNETKDKERREKAKRRHA